MKYRTIGKPGDNEMNVSAISFGCWEMGGDSFEKESDETNVEAIREALSLGITSFDTAEGYGGGHSERVLAQALAGRRSECNIASKVAGWNLGADDVLRAAEASLRRLQTEYIDIYYVHWSNPDFPIEGTMSAFNRLKEEGLIRAIGLSNFSLAEMEEAARYARIDVIQPEYSLLERSIEADIVPYCLEHGIGILSFSSIAKGLLTGAFHSGKQLSENDFRTTLRFFLPEHLEIESALIDVMKGIAEKKGVLLSQVAVSWLLHRPGLASAIVGTQNIGHLRSNADAADLELTEAENQLLESVSRQVIDRIDRL